MKIKLVNFLFAVCFFLLSSCGGVSFISQSNTDELYTKKFLAEIELIKALYRKGNEKEALTSLKIMSDEKLLPAEQAMRRNLLGVFHFTENNYEQAILNFELSLPKARLDKALTAQIYINLSSSYYKLGHIEKSLATTNLCQPQYLTSFDEKKKYHRLRYNLAKELGQGQLVITSLINYLSDRLSISELKSDPLFERLVNEFFKMSNRSRLRIFEEFEESRFFNISYLAYLDIEKLYYQGIKSDAMNLMEWLEGLPKSFPEIKGLVENLQFRIQNYAKMDPLSIGIILPLSGKKAKFGKRALIGIDSGVRIEKDSKGNSKEGPSVESKEFNLHVSDSKGSGVVGALRVKELIEKHYVSIIIGGLFSGEATKEYLEARKHGVFFISLSEIYLPKDQKDHLLLEIPGSVESQVSRLFSSDMLSKFGKKAAIIFPKTTRGEAFVDEFWRKAKSSDVEVVGVHGFEKSATDHRGTVKNLLGLKFPRERQEELELISEIHSLEKSSSIRRVQTLKPKIDFDWIFLPILPREALQIIPAFTYYDAFKLNLIGGPSWRSRSLVKDSYKLGQMIFVGDGTSKLQDNFKINYEALFKKAPKLIEMRAYDSYKIVTSLLLSSDFSSRDELDLHIRSRETLDGITGTWQLEDGVWLKNMTPLKIKRGKISRLNLEPPASTDL